MLPASWGYPLASSPFSLPQTTQLTVEHWRGKVIMGALLGDEKNPADSLPSSSKPNREGMPIPVGRESPTNLFCIGIPSIPDNR
eukprot:3043441-Rhodomonas_salina.1